jgi:YVTN family beta-propeller protein
MRTRMSILLTLTLSLLLIPVLGGTQRPSATESQPASPRIQNASATPAEGVTATIAVGAIPAALALDETTGKLYVANFGSDSVSVIDAASLTVVSEIDVGISPLAIAVHPARHRVYVLNQGSNSVSVIDSETQRPSALNGSRHPRRCALCRQHRIHHLGGD